MFKIINFINVLSLRIQLSFIVDWNFNQWNFYILQHNILLFTKSKIIKKNECKTNKNTKTEKIKKSEYLYFVFYKNEFILCVSYF